MAQSVALIVVSLEALRQLVTARAATLLYLAAGRFGGGYVTPGTQPKSTVPPARSTAR